jgi:hemerythrin-like metal-binding protein
MQHFKWTKAHAVFLPEVDAEHRNLFRMAEELYQAVQAGQDTARVRTQMQALMGSVDEHFAHEERLMEAAQCESYAWHRQQHDNLRKKASQFVELFEAGDAKAPAALVKYMARWFKDHTALTDRLMGAQLRNSERLQTMER